MAVFELHGLLVATGKPVKGVRDADNPKVLARRPAQGRHPPHRRDRGAGRQGEGEARHQPRSRSSVASRVGDVAMMTRQLATLVRRGHPAGRVAQRADRAGRERGARSASSPQVREQLNEGTSFAKALEAAPTVFPPLYVNMVARRRGLGHARAGARAPRRLHGEAGAARGKVSAALAYPILMATHRHVADLAAHGRGRAEGDDHLRSDRQALPWYTRSSSPSSNFALELLVAHHHAHRRAASGGFVAGSERQWAACGGTAFCLKAPIFGTLFRMLAVARFARTLATLLESGRAAAQGDGHRARTCSATRCSRRWSRTPSSSIREGESIAEPLKRSGRFPPIVTHMIAVGEKTGQLEQMLENVANAYDSAGRDPRAGADEPARAADDRRHGGAVGFIAFSILMPLIQMNDFVQ